MGTSESDTIARGSARVVEGSDSDDPSCNDGPMRRAPAGVKSSQETGQKTRAREREDLAGVAENDPVEGCDQSEKTDPNEQVQPAALRTDHCFHRWLGHPWALCRSAAPHHQRLRRAFEVHIATATLQRSSQRIAQNGSGGCRLRPKRRRLGESHSHWQSSRSGHAVRSRIRPGRQLRSLP